MKPMLHVTHDEAYSELAGFKHARRDCCMLCCAEGMSPVCPVTTPDTFVGWVCVDCRPRYDAMTEDEVTAARIAARLERA